MASRILTPMKVTTLWSATVRDPQVAWRFISLDFDANDPRKGGDFSPSGEDNMPYRGLDSTYQNRWCSVGDVDVDTSEDPNSTIPIGVTPNASICNHYEPEEVEEIPHISSNVKAALDFLSKDDDGFFLMYEQGGMWHVGSQRQVG